MTIAIRGLLLNHVTILGLGLRWHLARQRSVTAAACQSHYMLDPRGNLFCLAASMGFQPAFECFKRNLARPWLRNQFLGQLFRFRAHNVRDIVK